MKHRTWETNEKYKKYKNKWTTILCHCEKLYYSELWEYRKINMRMTWNVLNKIVRNKSKSNYYPDSFSCNSKQNITNKKEIADEFNHFFC